MALDNQQLDTTVGIESPEWLYIFSGVILTILLTIGVLFNGVILFVFMRNKNICTIQNIFLVAVVLNGFFMTLISFIFPTLAEFSGGFLNVFSFELCTMEAFVVYFFGLTILLLNTSIAIYRYLVVCRSIANTRVSHTTMIKVVLGCEGVALTFALCPLLGWGSYGLEIHGTSCGLAWNDKSVSSYSYLITIGILCYLIPVLIIIYSYWMIWKVVSVY